RLSINIYDDLMPGAKLPDDVVCKIESDKWVEDVIPCRVRRDNQLIGITYNRRVQVIDYASYLDLRDTIGELLRVWGYPDGYTHDKSSWEFYWNDRQAYIVPRYGLSLYSKVGVLTFGTPRQDYQPWPTYSLLPHD